MDYLFVKSAGALAVRGAIAIVLGLFALLMPGMTFLALTIAFGIYALIDGISALVTIFDRHTHLDRGWLAVEAIAGILVGIFVAASPTVAAINLAWVIGFWAVVTGVIKIVNAIRLRKVIEHEGLLILSGLASVLFGAIVASMPAVGIVGMMWTVGIFGLLLGGLLLGLSFKLRRWETPADKGTMPRAA